jgi:hypothetical protein
MSHPMALEAPAAETKFTGFCAAPD